MLRNPYRFLHRRSCCLPRPCFQAYPNLAQINFYQNGLQVWTFQPKATSQGDLLVSPTWAGHAGEHGRGTSLEWKAPAFSQPCPRGLCTQGSHTRNAGEPRCAQPPRSAGSGNAPAPVRSPRHLISLRPLDSQRVKETTELPPRASETWFPGPAVRSGSNKRV